MKARYIEHSSGPRTAIGVLVTDSPVPQERPEETFFRDTPFKVAERPVPKLATSN